MRKIVGFALMLCGSFAAQAGSICPGGIAPNPFPHSPDAAATGCNTVLTINANGSITVTVPDSAPYEGSEDVLVGIVNNSSTPVTAVTLTGGAANAIFGFEGDGICIYTFTGSSYCTASQKAGNDPGDYQGPTSTFTNINPSMTTGTVNFNPPIPANGGSTYFSLEGLPTGQLSGTVGGGTPPGTPAPSSLVLLGIGLSALIGWSYRAQIKATLLSKRV